ncbi:TonB-dependent receptor [Altererythrobacter indicus]|uniref:TonB-dependent receptor n=1 Tax=Altericroceibacterium indicum TaxID=374177 RepID=A0A845AAJ8_9SPHN|nr:TonB-dependent receptor [Altericroceibacterium indicum]MXP26714.1 TonB-dependent receptor [Altericroceibacterium indicum]
MKKHVYLVAASLAAIATPAMAQDQSTTTTDANSEPDYGQIVVTAQKSSELLTKAAVAVSVVSQDSLDRQNITTAENLVSTAPNLQLSQNGFSIRGIGSNNAYSGYSTVATQIDGIYEPSAQVLKLGLFDLSSVEVLRGPQGTVYGRNATAGVVNINTRDPGNDFGVDGDFQYASNDSVRTRLAVDLPVTDDWSLRFAALHEVDDGYEPKLNADDNFSKANTTGLRLTSLAHLTSNLDWRVAVSYGKNKGTIPLTYLRSYIYYPDADLQTGTFGDGVLVNAPDDTVNPGSETIKDNRQDITYYGARSRLTWNATDNLTATLISGYSQVEDDGMDAATGVYDQQGIGLKTKTWSNELDVNYENGPLSIVAGAYIYQDKQDSGLRLIHAGNTAPYPFNSVYNAAGANYAGEGFEISTINAVDVLTKPSNVGSRSQALFGQIKYELTDSLRLTGGIRATWDQVYNQNIQLVCSGGTVTRAKANVESCPVAQIAFTDDTNRDKATFSKVNWKLGAEYDLTPDVLGYASVSTGYRSGGLEASTNPEGFTGYNPETVTNYEAGLRADLLDRRLFVGLTGYWMDYNDLQVSSVIVDPLQGPVPVTTNAAKARIRGVELETTFRPTSQDRFTAYVSFLDTEFRSYPDGQDSLHSADTMYNILAPAIFGYATIPSATADFTGNRLANAPKWSGRFSYAHDFYLFNGVLTPSVDFYVQSSNYGDVANYRQSRNDSYTKTDLNLTYVPDNSPITLTAFVTNLENDRQPTNVVTTWSSTVVNYKAPRIWGGRIGFKF